MADNIITLTTDNFQEEISKSTTPVLVDLWAEWCGPCRLIAPILEEIAREHPDSIRIGKLNVDEHPSIAATYDVMSIPTLLLFKDGKEERRIVGARPKHALVAELSPYL